MENWFHVTSEEQKLFKFRHCVLQMTQCGHFRIFLSRRFFREINFGEFGSSESAIFAILGALNFLFWELSAYKNAKNHKD